MILWTVWAILIIAAMFALAVLIGKTLKANLEHYPLVKEDD